MTKEINFCCRSRVYVVKSVDLFLRIGGQIITKLFSVTIYFTVVVLVYIILYSSGSSTL